MTGTEQCLGVFFGKIKVAQLRLVEDALHWQYTEAWQQAGYAVSPHLPLSVDIPSQNVQRFLRNFLPEGNGLETLLSAFHLSKYNTFGLIQALGLDIPGALVVLAPEQRHTEQSIFRPIAEQELIQRLESPNREELIVWDGKPRLSVAGVQDKINVLLNEHGQLGFGEGDLCSTHLLKFEAQADTHLVLNEYLSMQLAKKCGLMVADVQLKRYGNYSALLVARFDRHYVSSNEVKRRHFIDGCQALNLPPEYKYERNFGSGRDVAHIREGVSLSKLFMLAEQCINPALAKQQLLDWVLFNLLINNFDAHGKNISFYVGINGLTLTPFYDLVNIKLYPEFEHEMAMAIGDEFRSESIHAYQLADFAETCGLPRAWLAKRLSILIYTLTQALNSLDTLLDYQAGEESFLRRYQKSVQERCHYLQRQAVEISTIEL